MFKKGVHTLHLLQQLVLENVTTSHIVSSYYVVKQVCCQ